MLNLRKLLPTLALAAVSFTAVLADTMPKDLANAYSAIDKAMKRLDFKAFISMFDPDFVLVDPAGGSSTRASFVKMVEPVFKSSQSVSSNMVVKRAHVDDDFAEVRFELRLHFKGKSGGTKIHELGTDFWRKKNGKWVLYRTVDEKMEMSGAGAKGD